MHNELSILNFFVSTYKVACSIKMLLITKMARFILSIKNVEDKAQEKCKRKRYLLHEIQIVIFAS